MNFKAFVLIFVMLVSIVNLGCMTEKNYEIDMESQHKTNGTIWKQVTIRSLSQKKAGLTGGEGMQQIFGIAYAPSNPAIVYLVSDTTQVWKSIDGGNSWQMKHKGFLSNGGISISVDPVNQDIVFAAGSLHKSSRSSPADGIYRTIDGGETWKLVKQTAFFRGKEGDHFAFDPKSSDNSRTKIIYAGTHRDGLLVSKDGGDYWEELGFKRKRILDMEIDPTNPSLLYILTIDGLFRVAIKDHVISRTEKLGKELQGSFKTFALNPIDTSIMYITMGKKGIYKSTDRGESFFKLEKGLSKYLDYAQIAISPVNPDYLYISVQRWVGLNPLWSHDGGASWNKPNTVDKGGLSIAPGEYRLFTGPIAPHPYNSDIALTGANGRAKILKTIDGGISWSYSGSGYTGGRKGIGKTSQAFSQDPKKMVFFLIDHGPALTEDGGDTFRLLPVPRVGGRKSGGSTTPVGAVSPNPDESLIVTAIGAWNNQKLAVSHNNGETWRLIHGTDDNYKFIAFHPQKPNIIYAQGYISKDSGDSWQKLPRNIYAVFRGNGDIIYSIDGFGNKKSVIYRSNDQGKTWITPYSYLPIPERSITEIDIDPFNPDRIYVSSGRGLYIYDDRSRKWQKKGEKSGLSKDRFGMVSFKCIAVDPEHPEIVYTGRWAPGKGHSNGIFRSIDFGETWENITYNLGPEITVWSISVSPHDGAVYLGSSHGTWKLAPPY